VGRLFRIERAAAHGASDREAGGRASCEGSKTMRARMTAVIVTVSLAILLLTPSSSAAQESLASYDAIALFDVIVRDTIPKGVFTTSEILETVHQGERVTVIGKDDITMIGRVDQWLKVSTYKADGSVRNVGWAYNGNPSGTMNFEAVD
jgi:hypothetical protein